MDTYLELPRAAPEDVGMSSERLERCRDAARLYVDDGSKPCSAVLIGRCGQVVFEDTYGFSDVESGTALKEDAIFRLASMTKPVRTQQPAGRLCQLHGATRADFRLSLRCRRSLPSRA